ncbi:MAG: ATP-binding cassette domain-containing protein [Bacteroidota bacterium]
MPESNTATLTGSYLACSPDLHLDTGFSHLCAMDRGLDIKIALTLQGADGPYELEVEESLPEQGVIALMGPSGAGKTSVLRILAGLMRPHSGRIQFGETCWFDGSKGIHIPPQKRSLGMVFQDYALFPHFSVAENIAFGQRDARDPSLVKTWLERLQLTALADQKPGRLSGGQQQRVALARALISAPRLLLLDEPLAAQDTRLRQALQQELREMFKRLQLLVILVSHSRTEVVRLADEVWFLEAGRTQWRGSTEARFGTHREIEAEVIRIYPDRQMMALWTGKQMLEAPWDEEICVGERLFFRKNQWINPSQ